MEPFHAFFESLDAWTAQATACCRVYAMQYTHTHPMSTQYNIVGTEHIIQLTQIEHNIAHHCCLLIGKHDNLMTLDKAQTCADRADAAWEKLLDYLSAKGFGAVTRARIGIPDGITVTYTYLPTGFLDAE